MNGSELVIEFMGSCFSGVLSASECGPVWQLSGIAALILAAVAALAVLRLRALREPNGSRA